jgi:EamA domain-containing membrane protein RarD
MNRRLVALGLAIAAIVLVVIGIVLVGDHPKRGGLAFVIAAGFAAVAVWFFTRGSPQPE